MIALLAIWVTLDKQINVACIGDVADGGIRAQSWKPGTGGVGVSEECSCTDGALAIPIRNSRSALFLSVRTIECQTANGVFLGKCES